ncbi:hypothetical protein T439DRAFT_377298 [Meredithblackwellia eburnea MCA 4105]
MPLLPGLFSSSLQSAGNASLVIVSDSILQPGLRVLRSLIEDSITRKEPVIVISLEQTRSRLVPLSESTLVDFVDCTGLGSAFAAASSKLPDVNQSTIHLDLHSKGGVPQLEKELSQIVGKRRALGKPILVVLDSVDELGEEGVDVVFRLVKMSLDELKTISGSRFITVVHSHHPLPAPQTSTSQLPLLYPSILSTLLSPALSAATVHLTLYPSPLLELLSRDYGLSIPLTPTPSDPLDVRLPSFLASFASRSWGDPFILPSGTGVNKSEDVRVTLDLLGARDGKGCVVHWTARGVNVPSEEGRRKIPVFTTGAAGGVNEQKKVVQWGLEALKDVNGKVRPATLGEVLSKEKMARMTVPSSLIPTPASTSTSAPPPSSATKPTDPPLPFNLSLTDSQKAAREEVVLPFLPKEDGQPSQPGGSIEYVPDEGDDMDDDDPDEDLEI